MLFQTCWHPRWIHVSKRRESHVLPHVYIADSRCACSQSILSPLCDHLMSLKQIIRWFCDCPPMFTSASYSLGLPPTDRQGGCQIYSTTCLHGEFASVGTKLNKLVNWKRKLIGIQATRPRNWAQAKSSGFLDPETAWVGQAECCGRAQCRCSKIWHADALLHWPPATPRAHVGF